MDTKTPATFGTWLLDLAHEAIIVRDVEGRILLWNGGATALYGWREEDVRGQDVAALLHSRSSPGPDEALTRVLAEGSWEGEVNQRHRDGSIVTVESRQVLRVDD